MLGRILGPDQRLRRGTYSAIYYSAHCSVLLDTLHLCRTNLGNARAVQNAHRETFLPSLPTIIGAWQKHICLEILGRCASPSCNMLHTSITYHTALRGTFHSQLQLVQSRICCRNSVRTLPNSPSSRRYTHGILCPCDILYSQAKTFARLSTLAPFVGTYLFTESDDISTFLSLLKEYLPKQLVVGSLLPVMYKFYILLE